MRGIDEARMQNESTRRALESRISEIAEMTLRMNELAAENKAVSALATERSAEIDSAEEKINVVLADNAALKDRLLKAIAEADTLKAELTDVENNGGKKSEIADFNRILQNACREVAETKEETRVRMSGHIEEFSEKWMVAQTELYDIVSAMDNRSNDAQKKFREAVDAVLGTFEELQDCMNDLYGKVEEIDAERERKVSDLYETVDKLAGEENGSSQDAVGDTEEAGSETAGVEVTKIR